MEGRGHGVQGWWRNDAVSMTGWMVGSAGVQFKNIPHFVLHLSKVTSAPKHITTRPLQSM